MRENQDRKVTDRQGEALPSVANGLESIWLFGSARREYRATEAKTTKDQTILKRTESAFIEPMQCKPVAALPAGEKWTFEVKLDGYRFIAAKRAP